VLFTSAAETLGALRSAGALTAGMPAEVLLLVPLIVPFPLSLEEPPTPMSFVCRRIGELLRGLPDGVSVEACVLPCRNPAETILNVLKPRSLVLIGARRHDLFARPWRLARKLRRAGHEVLIAGPA
ncbi:MAG TPA: hypothetical protein VFY29_00140, partial [Terriglobia bacterium]|nr:hypothetical protein [Terriglobia bacterium]